MDQVDHPEPTEDYHRNSSLGTPFEDELPRVDAETVHMTSSNARDVTANMVEMNQSNAGKIIAEDIRLSQGGIGMLKAQSAHISDSGIGAVVAQEVVLSDSLTGIVLSDLAQLNDSFAGMVITRKIDGGPNKSIFLLAGKNEGNVETVIDTPRAILFGLSAGIGLGLIYTLQKLLFNRS